MDVSTVAAVRGVFVLLPSSCRRVCRRMYLLPSSPPPFLVHGAVLTGTATFFFFINCYTSTGHNQIVIEKIMLCASCSCRKNQSDTRLRTAQRRGHPLGKDYPSCSDQMTRSRGLLTPPPLLSYNCESHSFLLPRLSQLTVCLSCTRRWYRRHGRSRIP